MYEAVQGVPGLADVCRWYKQLGFSHMPSVVTTSDEKLVVVKQAMRYAHTAYLCPMLLHTITSDLAHALATLACTSGPVCMKLQHLMCQECACEA